MAYTEPEEGSIPTRSGLVITNCFQFRDRRLVIESPAGETSGNALSLPEVLFWTYHLLSG